MLPVSEEATRPRLGSTHRAGFLSACEGSLRFGFLPGLLALVVWLHLRGARNLCLKKEKKKLAGLELEMRDLFKVDGL